jgi:hypothetical protein
MEVTEILRERSGLNSSFASFGERSLEVKVSPRDRVCRENMCHFVLKWMIELCKRNELVRKVVSKAFCMNFAIDESKYRLESRFQIKPKTVLELCMWSDVGLWKEIRAEIRELLIISLLIDGIYRKDLGMYLIIRHL